MIQKKTLISLCWVLFALSHCLIAQSVQKGLTIVSQGQKQGMIDAKGRYVLKPKYERILPVNKQNKWVGFILSKKDKYGYFNPQGKAIIPLKYDFVNTVNSTNVEAGFIVSKNQKDALFSSKGKRLTGFAYERMYRNYTQEPAILVKKNGAFVYLNLEGKEITTKRFDQTFPFYLGTAVIGLQQKQGAIDSSGHYVLEPKYDLVERLKTEKPLFKVKIGDAYGVVGAKDKVIIPVAYDNIKPVNPDQIEAGFIVKKGKKNALFSSNGKPLTGFDYLFIIPNHVKAWADSSGYSYNLFYSPIPDGYAASKRILARKKDKYGYLNLQGKEVIPFVYTEASNFYDEWAKVKKQGFSFVINEAGAEHRQETTLWVINECYSRPSGGMPRFYKNIYKKLRYPANAKKRGIKGKVHIQFVAEKDGTLTNPKILHGLGYGCDEEAIRLIKTARKWLPGCHRGTPKRANRSIEIIFAPK